MFADIFEDIFQPIFSDLFGLSKICQAIRFNGVNNYGQLATRAIDPDGDIDIEWYQIGFNSAATRSIVTQSITSAFDQREFTVRWLNGLLDVRLKGASIIGSAAGAATADGLWRLVIPSTGGAQVYLNGVLIATSVNNRGVFSEPSAQTVIGARNNAGTFVEYFQGILAWIKINDTYYPLADAGQAIQLPTPSGLGDELITQQVLENPAVRGSQWTYLGAGRWQYVGDGTSNALQFIDTANQPAQGYLDFEVESITGVMSCTIGSSQNPSAFSSIGRHQYFYTSNDVGNLVRFRRAGTSVASCIIKNISFKPLGTSNPMTLFNTVPEQWEQIACDLRPEA